MYFVEEEACILLLYDVRSASHDDGSLLRTSMVVGLCLLISLELYASIDAL